MAIQTTVPEMPPTTQPEPFYIGYVKITPTSSGAFWINRRAGRSRFVSADSALANSIRAGQILENVDKTRREFAEGTHEPMVYFRDANGKIGIPPDPSMIPVGAQRLEANSLRAIDAVMSELNCDHLRDFTDDEGRFQEGLDNMLASIPGAMTGNPRQYLVESLGRSMSNIQRDVTRLMISELDNEAAQRQRITSETRHHEMGR